MKKKILILGPLGQDGKLLSSILEKDKYDIYGICKKNTLLDRIEFHQKNFDSKIIMGDLTDYSFVEKILDKINPEIVVNFCGVTDVFNPWNNISYIYEQNCKIPLNILNYIHNKNQNIFLFQSSSSLMYGRSDSNHINHLSNFSPIYPYGVTKLHTHNYIIEYRKNFNLKCSSGIFFNHDSQYRGEKFLTKKISTFISRILSGKKEKLELGDLTSKIDISHALDFMYGVKHIIENNLNDDYIFSSGKLISVEELVKLFFNEYNLKMEDYVIQNKLLKRKDNINIYGDTTKLNLTGWEQKKTLKDLVCDMVNFDINYKNFIY